MDDATSARSCTQCGGPVSKKNISGFCSRSPECARERQRVIQRRWYEAHRDQVAEKWAAYSPGYKERRAELDAQRRQDLEFRKRQMAAVQAFKTDPANAERVREYNRRGRQKYMARDDRPCLNPGGCSDHARIGSIYCREHGQIAASHAYYRTAAGRKWLLAERQEWVCPWCKEYLPPTLDRTHVDHIIPRASGLVIEEEWNFQLLHARCNQQKSGKVTPQAVALAAEHGLILHAAILCLSGSELQLFLITYGYAPAREERSRVRRGNP
jgi:5-methylcytosine-specific restriction endonuclease McrA